jgi:hypothetical protein
MGVKIRAILSGCHRCSARHDRRLRAAEGNRQIPAADANGSFDLSPKQGKIALLRTTTPLTVSSPTTLANTADFIGYGMADAWEGSYPAIAPERWYALFRLDGSDTNDNYWDFDWDYPAPRNSKSPATLMIKRKK